MSRAEELLNTLAGDDSSPVLRLANPETEPHIVVGDDRFITVPKELQRIAVQFDHDVETVTFDCPRYWDGLDMSQLFVYINYMRKDRITGCYKATNVTVDETDSNIMHFDWTISKNVSQVKGELRFLVCIKKADEEGNEVNHWNSELNTEMYVSEGLETGDAIVARYPDIILQWEADVQEVKDILLAAKEAGEFNGATYVPSVDLDGNLSWTNEVGLPNPEPVNIKGYSPVILVREIEGGRELIITDQKQSQTVQILDGEDGYSPVILVREIEGGRQLIITDQRQSQTVTIMDGIDGVSPTITTENIEGGVRVTITDATGTKSFDMLNGTDGDDGVSPSISIIPISGGHRVSITDASGTQSFDVMDGTQEISEAVINYMDSFVYIGEVEPASGPILWLDTSATSAS